jgi:glyoxylase-like metal-dependent hydrolase (beta-lactamase superfamily II)
MTMPAPYRRSVLLCATAAIAAMLGACATPSENAADVLARAVSAMGSGPLKTLRYSGEGSGTTFGQAYVAGATWPKVNYHSVVRSIDYEAGAMRDEIVLSRAEPHGGGGYPLSGQQRNDQYLSGEIAWNLAGTNVVAGPRFVADVLKAAARYNASVKRQADGASRLSFTQPGRYSATITIGTDGLVSQVDSTFPDPVLGDTKAVTIYSDYRDQGGVKFPTRVRQSVGGFQTLDLAIKEVQANPQLALAVPEAARNQAERVVTEKVAEGVWFVAGGSHNSVAIEMADHLVLVETPLNDARTLAVIDAVKALVPGKAIRYAINSHQHFDHSGGVRAAVAEGATIVTQAANVAFFESVLKQANSVRPDRMAQANKPARLQGVADKAVMSDATRSLELHRIAGSVHTESFLMVYLPKEKLLIEADAFTPGPPNAPPPAVPNANHLNLIDNIERLKLGVERILPLHGRVVPVAELYTAAGKTPPR